MHFKNRYTQVISAVIFSILLFTTIRLFFYFSYFDYFGDLTFIETLKSFFMGVRVDVALIFTFTSIIWLILLLPFKFTTNKIYRSSLGVLWGAILGGIIFFNIGDILYFGFVNRHLNNELSLIGNDVGILVDMVVDFYLIQTILGTIFYFTIVYFFYKVFGSDIQNKTIRQREWANMLLVIIIAFIGIRGKLDGISFGTSDAFAVNKVSSGNLALNGFFCYYRGGTINCTDHSAIKSDQAVQVVKDNLASEKFEFMDNNFPLMRKLKPTTKNNYNIVIIMIESLSARYLDELAHNNFKVTPTLDKLAHEGQLFTNFYANGQRSQEGITTIYTGLTQPVGFENLGEGLELYNPSYLGEMAHKNGYSTLAMQSSDRGSFRVDKLSALAGFREYYGAEDIERTGEETGQPNYGAWDGNSLRFLSSKLKTIKEPFVSFCFTASTHSPFYSPGKQWEKYPHDVKSENGFLNTLNYVDTQIKEFMEASKKEPWFDNTIFIFTADHANQTKISNEKEVKLENIYLPEFHIPLIIYAPKLIEPKRTDIISSQGDIVPTIIDILGWQNNFTTIGSSLFDESVKNRFAFVKMGSIVGLSDYDGSIFYNFKNLISKKGSISDENQQLLLSIDSAQAHLLKNSKWMKKD
ncbi:membrane intrinsic sulfatase [Sulfurimonas gotlandica GD1]|uniref:Membrane intrinsic sulfatase n=1 Tax=Sulfurimonas gotlandica (strain DSM 19862 / JCM 16533 / GD1) TaxID=929558 RepID=B6BIW9_SULGG|nr:LTA synthase family protein [Sulfurimonas gotlandica]EDZ63508.1 phosphoglycerol transferase family protein [Sulfurimonas gotlandica GD1]EHP30480.1 membrane intrinsic sulfatase [Sulfurimonas gotlandica GD1]